MTAIRDLRRQAGRAVGEAVDTQLIIPRRIGDSTEIQGFQGKP
jgi:hypothetical protein